MTPDDRDNFLGDRGHPRDAANQPPIVDGARHCILVAGPHRSGTSAVTRTLNLLGAALPGDVIPPAPDNPEGFWESAWVIDFHDRFLAEIGSTWDDPCPLPQHVFELEVARAHREELLARLKSDLPDAACSVIKDPRLCKVMPLWWHALDALEIKPTVVIPVRNPLETALSIGERTGMDKGRALAFWTCDMLCAERHSRGRPRRFVSYDAFVADPDTQARWLRRDLAIATLQPPADDEALSRQWRNSNRRHRLSAATLEQDPSVAAWTKLVFRWAQAASQRAEPDTLSLDITWARLTRSLQALGRYLNV